MNYQERFEEIAFCPITKALMVDPVLTLDGFSYEKEALNRYLDEVLETKDDGTVVRRNRTPKRRLITVQTRESSIFENSYLKNRLESFYNKLNGRTPTEDDYRAFVEQYDRESAGANKVLENALKEFFDSLAICPITREKMLEPVIAPDGICYEKNRLDLYLKSAANKTPTGTRVPTEPDRRAAALIPNRTLERAIKHFNDQHVLDENSITAYFQFFEAVSREAVTTDLFEAPVIHGVKRETETIEGGISSLETATYANHNHGRNVMILDPCFAGESIARGVRLLPGLIAYAKLQQAILTLKERVKDLPITALSEEDHRELALNLSRYSPSSFFEPKDPSENDFMLSLPSAAPPPSRAVIGNPLLEARAFCVSCDTFLLFCLSGFLYFFGLWFCAAIGDLTAVHNFSIAAFVAFCLALSMTTLVYPITSLIAYFNPKFDPRYYPWDVKEASVNELQSFLMGTAGIYCLLSITHVGQVITWALSHLAVDPLISPIILSLALPLVIGALCSVILGEQKRSRFVPPHEQPAAPEQPTSRPYLLWKPEMSLRYTDEWHAAQSQEIEPVAQPLDFRRQSLYDGPVL